MPTPWNFASTSFDHFSTTPFTTSSVETLFPPTCFFREVNKITNDNLKAHILSKRVANSCFLTLAVWGLALSCSRQTPLVNKPLLLFWIALNFFRVLQYLAMLKVSSEVNIHSIWCICGSKKLIPWFFWLKWWFWTSWLRVKWCAATVRVVSWLTQVSSPVTIVLINISPSSS